MARLPNTHSVLHVKNWPVAAKLIALSIGVAAALAIGLTSVGYAKASAGLKVQAEAALGSDAQLAASAIDEWNGQRVTDLAALAKLPSLQRLLRDGDNAVEADRVSVQDALMATSAVSPDVDSIGILDRGGSFVLSSNPKDLGSNVKQRDYFTEALKGSSFISGVSISTITNAPSIFHSVPVRDASGNVLGVIRSRANLDHASGVVSAARDRVGSGAQGVLMDEYGLVVASSVSSDWLLRPVVTPAAAVSDSLARDKRWGNAAQPDAVGEGDLGGVIGATKTTLFDWRSNDVTSRALAMPLQRTHWVYVAAMPITTFNAAALDFLMTAAAAAIIGLLLGSALAVFVARSIARALQRVQSTLTALAETSARGLAEGLDRMAANDLTCAVANATPTIERFGRDEIGQTAAVTNALSASLHECIRSYEQARTGLAEAVRHVQRAAESIAESSSQLGSSSNASGAAVQQVAQAIMSVAIGAQDTNRNAHVTQDAVVVLSDAIKAINAGSEEQATDVQHASTMALHMAQNVEHVARSASSLGEVTQHTRLSAEHGATAVRDTVSSMSEISEVVRESAAKVQQLGDLGDKIGAVVETIDDIAEQTNLLALNAAIESARAGEHGRGFAVVADEVRKLAERATGETKRIAQLIQQVQLFTREAVASMARGATTVNSGVARAEQAGSALDEILQAIDRTVEQVQTISDAVHGMNTAAQTVTTSMTSISREVEASTAATQKMTIQAGEVTAAMDAIAHVTRDQSATTELVTANTEEMSAQVEEMSAQADELAATAAELRALVARFTVEPRAALVSLPQHVAAAA